MRNRILWIAAALVLIAIPAVVGLVALRGDDDGSSSTARRAAALVDLAGKGGSADTVVVMAPVTPAGKGIDVLSWSWGATQPASAVALSGAGTGKVQMQEFQFTKAADESSPALFLHCANGAHIKLVEIKVRKAGATPIEFMKIKLHDVIVAGVQQSRGGAEMPTEQVSLNFAKVEFEYTPQRADGSLDTANLQRMGWDLKLNAKV